VTIQPIAKNSRVDRVVEQIRGLIEQGQLRAGDRLPTETDLVERLQVSRGALREAIRRLETLGLLTVEQGRGMFVADSRRLTSCVQLFRSAMAISPKDSVEFAEFRRLLECHAVRQAAELATSEEVAELRSLCDQMNRPGLGYQELVELDWQFHRLLVEIAGSELQRNIMEVLQEFMVAGMWHTTRNPRDLELSPPLHRAIVEAIDCGDADAAEQAMQVHMDALVRLLHEIEDDQPGQSNRRARRRPARSCAV
jgi:DNA-binding FadR family transcriptional regulator